MRGACAQVMYGETTTMAKCLYSNIINGKIICLCFIEVSCVAHTHTHRNAREKNRIKELYVVGELYICIYLLYTDGARIFSIYMDVGGEGGG